MSTSIFAPSRPCKCCDRPSRPFPNAKLAKLALFASVVLCVPAKAQNRTGENAVTQAEDAFGFSVGRDSIGIYSPGNARGFSPTAAGNLRINGLYYDPTFFLLGTLIETSGIKVGLSAQGYPFAAPSGIVDFTLRIPDEHPGGTLIVGADDWGGSSIELDGSVSLAPNFGMRGALNATAFEFPNGTDNRNFSASVLARWKPLESLEIMPFWSRYDDTDDESGTFYIPAGSYIAKVDKVRHDEGPRWADVRFTATDAGVLANADIAGNWVVRLGAFRSTLFNRHFFSHFLIDEQPDGTAERILVADPPNRNRSLSGEARLTHSIPDGPRLHVLHLSLRGRDARREFGGSDVVSFGIGRVGERVHAPRPEFNFGEKTTQHLRQYTYGFAYDGRWKDVGEISFSLSRADYRKQTNIPDTAPVIATSRPWLYNGTAAIILSKAVSAYAGYARGLEESGVAPLSAANRNEPLETILTEQIDGGVRIALTPDLRAVVGLFDLERPYFGFDSANVFHRVGTVRSRGVEFSVSGKLGPNLNIVAGGVLLRPKVTANEDVPQTIGSKPVGLPTHLFNLNANWQTPLKTLQLDGSISHRGRTPATTDNLVYLRPRMTVSLGVRQNIQLLRHNATLRVQAVNLLDNNDFGIAGPGIYGPRDSRKIQGTLTVDF